MSTQTVVINPAEEPDLPGVEALLKRSGLPTLGVAEHFRSFLVAKEGPRLVGAIGLEVYGDTGLLRSAVVDPAVRNAGIGSMLYDELIGLARSKGIGKLVLLTNTAEAYFARKGFKSIDRATLSGPVTTSVEFSDACPSHAVCMELTL